MSNSGKNWFETGYGGADREQEKRDIGGKPNRWWMAPGTQKQLVFVDDTPVCFDEHQWRTPDSKFPSFAACTAKISQEPCVGCTSKGVQKADYSGHLTIVDITGYKNKKGEEVKYQLVEMAPKLKAMNKLKFKKASKGTMMGQLYTVTRTDENAPSTGDDFDFIRDSDMSKLIGVVTYRGKNLQEMIEKANGTNEDAKKMRKYLAHHFQIPAEGEIAMEIPAFNYQSLHAPMDPADFRRAVAGAVGFGDRNNSGSGGGGGKTGGGSGEADDSVPF